ncbi:DNA-directed RNA polymerase V subunit 5A [Ricinus communis]|uniref:DNA-directed RNA polymerase II, putative n=1 Tax=Ricinus communis TaxID=3988 RepID=B9ST46_RICCO|nr:DNA-directed RNA polymerase V subunit 5A [Ricinus communis]EEF33224.1 DNA-directed RNA polymerase II, putative [Ricinus communis]|eukprot:XP_002529165.1 DNA-directed RNA polymerase V subunit 5A [Ricinus communis]
MEENGVTAAVNGNGTDASERFNMEGLGKCFSSYADDGTHETHRYYLSRRTVLEMLRDRGYSVPSSEIDLSLQEFRAIHGPNPDIDRLKFSATHTSDPSKRMLVLFGGPGIIKVSTIRAIAGQIVNKDSLTGLILVLQNQITNQAMKAVDLFKFKVEMFQITDLLVNITKHVLKPKHQVLTDREKQKLLKDYCIEEKQLPRLLRKDAIARYYGLEKGQVVKVTYSGEITESHVTYRCVW